MAPGKKQPAGKTSLAPPAPKKPKTADMEIRTSFSKENKELTWEIEDLVDLLEAGEEPEVLFEMGETIGLPSKWRVALCKTATSGLVLKSRQEAVEGGISLCISLIESGAVKMYTSFRVLIVNPVIDVGKPYMFSDIRGTIRNFTQIKKGGYDNCLNLDVLKTLKASLSADFTITAKLFFTLYSHKCENKTTDQQNKAQTLVLDNLGQLLASERNSDFVIRVKKTFDSAGYDEVKVHKTILVAQSTVFFAMIESQMEESRRNQVTIEDLTVKGLKVLLTFFYTGKIDEDWKLVWEEIVNAADKYDLPILLSFLDGQLHTVATNENALDLCKVAKKHGLAIAYKKMLEYIKSNVEGVVSC